MKHTKELKKRPDGGSNHLDIQIGDSLLGDSIHKLKLKTYSQHVR